MTLPTKLADPKTQLLPEHWAVLLSLARALGFRLPGPHRGRTRDQLHIFWQRAMKSSTVPTEEHWHKRDGFWLTWPSSRITLWPDSNREPQHTARSTQPWTRGPGRSVTQMEPLVVLLHNVLAARAAAGEGPEPPTELAAEATRLLASGRVLAELHHRVPA